jgi:putative oxidoreductase
LTEKIRVLSLWLMNSLNRFADPVYCIMRLLVGLMFLCHGGQKVFGWFAPPGPTHSMDTMMLVAGWIEIVGGLLVAIGLLTRIAAFISSGEMAVAFFMVHAKSSLIPILNHGELAVLYCWAFLFSAFYGPGRWSIDAMIRRPSTTTATV